MKFILVALVALVGFANCQDLPTDIDDLEACKLFIKCCHKALEGGLPTIPIPNHNPLVIRNVSLNGSVALTKWSFSVYDNILYNLLDYSFPVLDATTYYNPDRVAYDYDLYWPKLNFTGKFEVNITTLFLKQHFKGSYNLLLTGVHWSGIFNLTKRGQEGIKEHLDDFTLKSKTEKADLQLYGLDPITAAVAGKSIETGIWTVFNNFPSAAADFLKKERFNGFWIDHPERIDLIVANCVSNTTTTTQSSTSQSSTTQSSTTQSSASPSSSPTPPTPAQ